MVFLLLLPLTVTLLFLVLQFLTAVRTAPEEVFSKTNVLAVLLVCFCILTDFDLQLFE